MPLTSNDTFNNFNPMNPYFNLNTDPTSGTLENDLNFNLSDTNPNDFNLTLSDNYKNNSLDNRKESLKKKIDTKPILPKVND